MNKELIKFIELCLADDEISDKEIKVIFRKAEELGVPKDECEIILEGLVLKNSKTVIESKGLPFEKVTEKQDEIIDSRKPIKKENSKSKKPIGFYGKNKNEISRQSAYRWYLKKYPKLTIGVAVIANLGVLPVFLIPMMVDDLNLTSSLISIALFYVWNDFVLKYCCKRGMTKVKKQNPDYNFEL
tara:strand:- start:694 stop:1248 length:555 start_codon:yes stop_codon:yes gene_type:complete